MKRLINTNLETILQIIFEPKLLDIKIFFFTLKINLFEVIKLVPRLFNEFKMSKGNKEKSYAEQLFVDNDLNQLQEQINTGNVPKWMYVLVNENGLMAIKIFIMGIPSFLLVYNLNSCLDNNLTYFFVASSHVISCVSRFLQSIVMGQKYSSTIFFPQLVQILLRLLEFVSPTITLQSKNEFKETREM